jgi:subtilisin family serine protease
MKSILGTLATRIQYKFDSIMAGNAWRVQYTPSPEYPEFPIELISQLDCVQYVEQVQKFESYQSLTQNLPSGTLPSSNSILWGLDRIDEESDKLDGNFKVGPVGTGVHIYILDSGIQANHAEFNSGFSGSPSRADLAYTVDSVQKDSRAQQSTDCTGHGTHVAGIAGGLGVGVAKNAFIHAIRVMGCDGGTNAEVIEGMEWVVKNGKRPAVINLSIGPSPVDGKYIKAQVMEDAIKKLSAEGISVVVSAGNQGLDACGASMMSAEGAFPVGASSWSSNGGDSKATFSNFGTCINLFAPGQDIVSASAAAKSGYAVTQGTSQAAPFVTGVIAQLLQKNPSMKPKEIYQELQNMATQGVVKSARNSGNRLLRSVLNGTADLPGFTLPTLNIDPALLTTNLKGGNASINNRLDSVNFKLGDWTWLIATGAGALLLGASLLIAFMIRRRRRFKKELHDSSLQRFQFISPKPTASKKEVGKSSNVPTANASQLLSKSQLASLPTEPFSSEMPSLSSSNWVVSPPPRAVFPNTRSTPRATLIPELTSDDNCIPATYRASHLLHPGTDVNLANSIYPSTVLADGQVSDFGSYSMNLNSLHVGSATNLPSQQYTVESVESPVPTSHQESNTLPSCNIQYECDEMVPTFDPFSVHPVTIHPPRSLPLQVHSVEDASSRPLNENLHVLPMVANTNLSGLPADGVVELLPTSNDRNVASNSFRSNEESSAASKTVPKISNTNCDIPFSLPRENLLAMAPITLSEEAIPIFVLTPVPQDHPELSSTCAQSFNSHSGLSGSISPDPASLLDPHESISLASLSRQSPQGLPNITFTPASLSRPNLSGSKVAVSHSHLAPPGSISPATLPSQTYLGLPDITVTPASLPRHDFQVNLTPASLSRLTVPGTWNPNAEIPQKFPVETRTPAELPHQHFAKNVSPNMMSNPQFLEAITPSSLSRTALPDHIPPLSLSRQPLPSMLPASPMPPSAQIPPFPGEEYSESVPNGLSPKKSTPLSECTFVDIPVPRDEKSIQLPNEIWTPKFQFSTAEDTPQSINKQPLNNLPLMPIKGPPIEPRGSKSFEPLHYPLTLQEIETAERFSSPAASQGGAYTSGDQKEQCAVIDFGNLPIGLGNSATSVFSSMQQYPPHMIAALASMVLELRGRAGNELSDDPNFHKF